MSRFIASMYKKSVFDIDYEKLKDKGIKCLVFDIDNTLAKFFDEYTLDTVKEKLDFLKKDFKVVLMSNNLENRVKKVAKQLDTDYVSFAMKPSRRGLRHIARKFSYTKKEMVMIGDQLLTDVWCGNRYGIMTILVDPLNQKDLTITGLNRRIEKLIFKRHEKEGLGRGKYYESK